MPGNRGGQCINQFGKGLLRVSLFAIIGITLSACESWLFYPMKPLLMTPDQIGLAYRDLKLVSVDGTRLHGWWLPAQGDPQATVLFVHGNAENISTHIASVAWLPKHQVNVLLLDYRGFGRSEGRVSITGAVSDVQAALDYLSATGGDLPSLPIVVLGQSLGASLAGVAVANGQSSPGQQAPRWPRLAGVVLDAGFSRYADIARDVAVLHPITYLLQWPVRWTMPEGLDLIDAVAQLSPIPLLIYHGQSDRVVKPRYARELYRAAREPKSLIEYHGGHIETFSQRENRQLLLAFIAGLSTAFPGSIRQH